MNHVTEILIAVQRGNQQAAADLLPLVYGELRKLAAARLAGESPAQSLNATALVHEAYLRLVGSEDRQAWDGRGHFFAAAAEAMRRILVESARRRQTQKHGGGVTVEDRELAEIPLKQAPEEIVAVSEALDRLTKVNSQAAELVKLRYFAGFTLREIADIQGISPRTADNVWAYARAWLAVELGN
jgi:RNA polymerase sigma factor (TIGR02999 family)